MVLAGFDLTSQKLFVSFANENNGKTDLNVAHHVSKENIFYSRLRGLKQHFLPFYLFKNVRFASEGFDKKRTVWKGCVKNHLKIFLIILCGIPYTQRKIISASIKILQIKLLSQIAAK